MNRWLGYGNQLLSCGNWWLGCGVNDWVMESVTGLSVSVTWLWEMMSGLWVVWVWVLVGHYVVESGLFGFVGMDLVVVVLLDFRWWWRLLCFG